MEKDYFVFLGGTCNGSNWRDEIMDKFHFYAFNPVVKDWNEEAQKQEIFWRENADYSLYVITPKMTGVYSIAEVVDDSNKRPERTIFCVLEEDGDRSFEKFQIKSLEMVKKMVANNGSYVFNNFDEVVDFLNKEYSGYKY